MRPIKENLSNNIMHSFRVKQTKLPYMDSPWHFHSEYEFIYTIKGSGKRIIGDSIENFYPGDLVLMGPNLPHVWQNGEEYYDKSNGLYAEVIVLQFKHNAFGSEFFSIAEMQAISKFLDLSKRGLSFDGESKQFLIEKMHEVVNIDGIQRFLILIEILDYLSLRSEYKTIASASFPKIQNDSSSERINSVFEYIGNHFQEHIGLGQIAEHANLSKTAFCRYFKAKTTKTFQQYLAEFRINYACKLLIQSEMSISQIAYECGFNSPTYFNRQFKSIKLETPKEYLLKYQHITTKHSL